MKNVFVAVCLFFLNNAFAGFQSGNELLNLYSDPNNTFRRGMVLGYVEAVIDTWGGIVICPPYEATGKQVLDIVIKYLEKHPESRHLSGDVIVTKAMQEVFPCANKK